MSDQLPLHPPGTAAGGQAVVERRGSHTDAPIGALVLTADDGIFRTVSAALTQDGTVRELRRARTLAEARSALSNGDEVLVMTDPRVDDAAVAEVGAWLRDLERPTLVLVPHDDVTTCLPSLGPDLAHHVLTAEAPEPLLVASVRRTIEQHREEAELARSLTDLRDRLAVARHELATPLGAIEGFLEVLIGHGDRLPADRRQESLEAAHRNVARLRRLVAQLNAVAKATGPTVDTKLTLVELGPRLRRLVKDLGPRADEVTVQVPDDLYGLVDTDHLEAIVINLVENAFKYGEVPIEIRAGARPGRVQIGVIDHGEGVPEDFVPHMFERYARAEEVRDRRQGSGIGLNLCAELAHAMGGSLRYVRARDGGAAFVLEVLADREAARAEGWEAGHDDARLDPAEVVVDVAAAEAEDAPHVGAEVSSDLPVFDALAYEATARAPGAAEGQGTHAEGRTNGSRDADEVARRRPVAGELQVVRDGLSTHTTVVLDYAGRGVEGRARGAGSLESTSRAVARATLDAVESFLDGAATFDVEWVRVEGEGDDQHVTVAITSITDEGYERLVGSALTRTDRQRAAMYATLDALNRRIERLLV